MQLLTTNSAGVSMGALARKLDDVLVGQQLAQEERAVLQQKVDKLSVHVRDGMELLQGGLGDLAQQQSETLRVASGIQESQDSRDAA